MPVRSSAEVWPFPRRLGCAAGFGERCSGPPGRVVSQARTVAKNTLWARPRTSASAAAMPAHVTSGGSVGASVSASRACVDGSSPMASLDCMVNYRCPEPASGGFGFGCGYAVPPGFRERRCFMTTRPSSMTCENQA